MLRAWTQESGFLLSLSVPPKSLSSGAFPRVSDQLSLFSTFGGSGRAVRRPVTCHVKFPQSLFSHLPASPALLTFGF